MARSFEELRKQVSPERRARSQRRAEELMAELRLREVRAACELTQDAREHPVGVRSDP